MAAEALTCAAFARAGCEVSVQYGANQLGYDLVVARGTDSRLVSVKGSQDGGHTWLLASPTAPIPNEHWHAHQLVDAWKQTQPSGVWICLVQFDKVGWNQWPRMYLASLDQVATHLKDQLSGHGDVMLYENHVWQRSKKVQHGTVDRIPTSWVMSESRIDEMFA